MGYTYAQVRTKFTSRMNRRDMSQADADGYLQDCITRIQRGVRVPAMEKAVLFNLDATYTTNGGLFIPSDYLKLRRMSFNEEYALRKEDESIVIPLAKYNTGSPLVFCRRGGLWFLGPTPDITSPATVIRVDYWAEFPAMINDTDETVLTDIASDLMVYGALSYACDHYSDKRGDKFETRFMQIVTDLESQGDDDELAGGAAIQPAYVLDDDLEGTW